MINEVTISLPEGYESETRRYALVLSLDPGLPVGNAIALLRQEGIVPPVIVATRREGSTAEAAELIAHIGDTHRLLDSPQARWICGTGHSAAEALRLVIHRPDLSSRTACLSTSFEGSEGAPPLHSRLLGELEELSRLPTGAGLYLDYGTVGLDECYEPYHRDAGAILRTKGGEDGREFEIRRITGGAHTPESWSERLGPALRWLATR